MVGLNASQNKDINGELNPDVLFYKPVQLKEKDIWDMQEDEMTSASHRRLSPEQHKFIREHMALEQKIEVLRRAKHEQEMAKKRRETEQRRRMQALYALGSGNSGDPANAGTDIMSKSSSVNVNRLP